MKRALHFILVVLFVASPSFAQSDDYQSLFNGKDLTGWSYLPTTEAQKKAAANWKKGDPNAPPWPIVEEKINFDGKSKSDDGRFAAEDGVLSVLVPAEGRKIQMLYSDMVVEGDFELRLEFRASTNADSGVFIRGRQLQCRDYPNAGPYKDLKKFKANDWNELVVVVKGETARCTCNGEILEEAFKVPATGPIGVEGDRGTLEYRNIRIRKAASSAGLLKPTNVVDSWHFEQHKDGKGTVSVEGDSVVFETISTGSQNWHVQAFQTGVELEEGAKYVVSFEIKGDRDDHVVLLNGSINEANWHSIGLYKELKLNKEFSRHEFKFKAVAVTPNNNRIGFVVGKQKGKVTVRNMTMRKAE